MDDLISRKQTLDAFGLSEKTRKYGGDHSGYNTMMLYEIQDVIEGLPSVNPQVNNEDIHREREQAYMKGYEDASRKYRTEQSEDAISRQEVIDATTKYCVLYDLRELLADIETLPSVSTEKTGEWLKTEVMQSGYKETWIKCNKCGYDTALLIPKKYCPNCGSQMEGVEE